MMQGDIIEVKVDTRLCQSGSRLALVISNDFFNQKLNLVILCPITDGTKEYPLHVPLDYRTETKGAVICEHIRTVDINVHECKFVESVPSDILESVINIVFSEIEINS